MSTSDNLQSILNSTAKLAQNVSRAQIPIGIIGILLNTFHVFILTRRTMRSNATNVMIIGIAVSDMIYLSYYVFIGLKIISASNCTPPLTWFETLAKWLFMAFRDVFRRVSAWLGVSLVLIRCLVVKYASQNKLTFLREPPTVLAVFGIVLLMSCLVSSLNYGTVSIVEYKPWIPPEKCSQFPVNYSQPVFEVNQNPSLYPYNDIILKASLFIDSLTKLIPPFLYPIFAVILILEVKKSRRRRKMFQKEMKEENVSNLVMLMTVSYIVTETPIGVAYWLQMAYIQRSSVMHLINNISVLFTTVLLLDCSLHVLICISMSSQYQSTVKQLFGNWRQKVKHASGMRILHLFQDSNITPICLEKGPDMQKKNVFEQLLSSTTSLALFVNRALIPSCIIGLVLNLFHFFMLTRKTMRSHGTNVLIIGIAVSDMVYMYYYINYSISLFHYDNYLWFVLSLQHLPYSVSSRPPSSWLNVLANWMLQAFHEVFRRLSAWLGVSLALVRCLVVKYAQKGKFQRLTEVRKSWIIVVTLFLISCFISSLKHGTSIIDEMSLWVADETCTQYPQNYSQYSYQVVTNPLFSRHYFFINKLFLLVDGTLKVIPPVLYPIFAVILILEVRKAGKRRRMLQRDGRKESSTTTLVVFMTVSFILTETPIGVSFLLQSHYFGDGTVEVVLNNFAIIFNQLFLLACSVHFFVCLILSSQYRSTVKQLFGCGEKMTTHSVTSSTISRTNL